MNQSRSALLTCVGVWTVLHTTHAALYRDSAANPLMYAAAVVGYLATVLLAATPLIKSGSAMSRTTAVTISAGACVVQWLDVASLQPGAITGYTNFAVGGLAVILPALVFSSHGYLAAAAAFGQIAIQWFVGWSHPGPEGFSPVTYLWLSLPPALWLVASLVVRRAMRRGEVLTEAFGRRSAEFGALAPGVPDSRRERNRRIDELQAEVVPFLERVESAPLVSADDRALAGRLAASLRDDLKARHLMSHDVRAAVLGARDRGARVVLMGDHMGSPIQDAVRDALPGILAIDGLHSVAVSIDSERGEGLIVIETAEHADEKLKGRLKDAVGDGLQLHVDSVDKTMLVYVRSASGRAARR